MMFSPVVNWFKRTSLVAQIATALVLGIAIALLFPSWASKLSILGTLFIAALKAVARAEVKFAGSDTPLTVAFGPAARMAADFEDQHRRRFGFIELLLRHTIVKPLAPRTKHPE